MTVKVIAEIGCNWAVLSDAVKMIWEAADAKADYIKFQVFNEETIKDSPLFEKLKPLILNEESIKILHDEAVRAKIGFILTPMYLEAVDLAAKYADIIKIRYKDHENQPLIDKAYDTGKTVLVSVPYQPPNSFNYRIKHLYCIPKYPPEPEDFNLDFAASCDGGFSSHYPHTTFDLAYAIFRDYEDTYLEKHVMFDEIRPIDAAVSLTFTDLKRLINELKLLERIRRIRL